MSASPTPRPAPKVAPRTLAICVVIALAAALAAGLVAALVMGDDPDDTVTNRGTLTPAVEIDTAELFAVDLIDAEGVETTIEDHIRDRPVVVNLWAESCVPCIKEMPWLEEASKKLPEVDFLGVNVLDELADAESMAEQTAITYPWVRDTDGDFLIGAQASGLPDTLLIDSDGTVLAAKLGAFASQQDIEQWITSNL